MLIKFNRKGLILSVLSFFILLLATPGYCNETQTNANSSTASNTTYDGMQFLTNLARARGFDGPESLTARYPSAQRIGAVVDQEQAAAVLCDVRRIQSWLMGLSEH